MRAQSNLLSDRTNPPYAISCARAISHLQHATAEKGMESMSQVWARYGEGMEVVCTNPQVPSNQIWRYGIPGVEGGGNEKVNNRCRRLAGYTPLCRLAGQLACSLGPLVP